MSITNFPHGLASFGVPVMGAGPVFTTGEVFFVSSLTGTAGADGLSPDSAVSTLQRAVLLATASQGDVIILLPGHSESVAAAAAMTVSKAGLTILGLGQGSLRPTFSFTTVVGASMVISAANVRMDNVLLAGGFDALTGPLSITGADCHLSHLETRDVTGQATDFIAVAATADRLILEHWVHRGAAALGADTAITILGGAGITIRDFWIDGNFAVAAIENVTAAATNLSIYGSTHPSYIRTRHANDVAITLVATATGNVGPNIYIRLQDDAANGLASIVGADMQFFLPIMIANADNEVGTAYNGTASGL